MQLIHQPLYKYIWLWKFEEMMILRQLSYEIVINVYVRAHTAWIHKFSAEQMYQYDQEINPNLANDHLLCHQLVSFYFEFVNRPKKGKFPFCLVILTISYTCMEIELGFEHSWFYFMSLFHCSSSVVETFFIMESYDTPIQIILL